MRLVFLSFILSTAVWAQSGTDLLVNGSTVEVPAKMVQVQKQISLDDPFLIQFYGVWKASRIYDEDFSAWVDLLLEKKFKEALTQSYKIKINSRSKREMVDATRLYLLWHLKLSQTFFNEWLELTVHKGFFKSQFAYTIDQLISDQASAWFVHYGIYLSEKQRKDLDKLKNLKSRFNYSAQAYFNLRSGVKGMELIGKLPESDFLRLHIADSVIVAYARKNQLANSAKLLKEVYEPVLSKEQDIDKLSRYHILLARLLYQAKAYEAAHQYYSLIPDESTEFLKAQSEKLWITMRNDDLATIKGDVQTLKMNIFEDKFMPEVYVVSAMANLKLCQFKEVEKNFQDFIRVQSKFAKLIDRNLKSNNPEVLVNDFFVDRLDHHQKLAKAEKKRLASLDSQLFASKISLIDESVANAKRVRVHEIKRRWRNREKMIQMSLRKMRFVKVEFLSLMRRLKSTLAKVNLGDKVNLKSSGIDKSNSVVFPYDGVTFSDELFHYKSDLTQLCLKERK